MTIRCWYNNKISSTFVVIEKTRSNRDDNRKISAQSYLRKDMRKHAQELIIVEVKQRKCKKNC